jgi:hypothetical protein
MIRNVHIVQFLLLLILALIEAEPLSSSPLYGSLRSLGPTSFRQAEKEEEEKEPPPPAARQNTILRGYFRSQYMNLRSERYDLNETFMEKYVDRQIDVFLADIDSRLEELRDWLDRAEEAHATMLHSEDENQKQQARKRLERALKEVDKSAGGLKSKLLNVFLRLDSKEDLPIEIGWKADFREEMVFLREQVETAEMRIRDYLFRATNTVPYLDLKGENMMIRLYWAEKTADRIRDLLRR